MRIYKKRHWVHFGITRPIIGTGCVLPSQINCTPIPKTDILTYSLHNAYVTHYTDIECGYLSDIKLEPPGPAAYRAWYRHRKSGGCIICGELESCCLTYHHIDPSTKSAEIGQLITARMPIMMIISEISKCILACRNCHAKIHNKVLSIQGIESFDYNQLLHSDPATRTLAMPIYRKPLTCKQCNSTFYSIRNRQKYCTTECSRQYARLQYHKKSRTNKSYKAGAVVLETL